MKLVRDVRGSRFLLAVSLVTVSLLTGGCVATKLEESLDLAIKIEKRCDAVFDAMPEAGDKRRIKEELLNSVALRLTGSCVTVNGKHCSENHNDNGGLLAAHEAAKKRLENNVKEFRQASQSLEEVLKNEAGKFNADVVEGIRKDIKALGNLLNFLQDDQVIYAKKIKSRIAELRKEINKKFEGVDFSCEFRSQCIRDLTKIVKQLQGNVSNDMNFVLDESVKHQRSLQRDGGQMLAIIERLKKDIAVLPKSNEAVSAPVRSALNNFVTSAERLNDSASAYVAAVVAVGRSAVGNLDSYVALVSGDVEKAMADFLAVKVYGKAAEKVLTLIESMLVPIDKLVDKLDDKFYVLASATTTLFSADIQRELDRVYLELVVKRFPSVNSQMALAGAACQRLYGDQVQSAQNPSMFKPFLLAMFTNIQVDAERLKKGEAIGGSPCKEGEDCQKGRIERLAEIRGELLVPGNESPEDFKKVVKGVYEADKEKYLKVSTSDMVGTCVASRQRIDALAVRVSGQRISAADYRNAAIESCGTALLAVQTQGDFDVRVTNKTVPPISRVGIYQFTDAVVMERLNVVPEVSAQAIKLDFSVNKPSPFVFDVVARGDSLGPSRPGLCARLERYSKAARCFESAAGYEVELQEFFPNLESKSVRLEKELLTVAAAFRSEGKPLSVTVYGYASGANVQCSTLTPSKRALLCQPEKDGNQALSDLRAQWGAEVLKKRAGENVLVTPKGMGARDSLDGNSPLDRRLRITVLPVK